MIRGRLGDESAVLEGRLIDAQEKKVTKMKIKVFCILYLINRRPRKEGETKNNWKKMTPATVQFE